MSEPRSPQPAARSPQPARSYYTLLLQDETYILSRMAETEVHLLCLKNRVWQDLFRMFGENGIREVVLNVHTDPSAAAIEVRIGCNDNVADGLRLQTDVLRALVEEEDMEVLSE